MSSGKNRSDTRGYCYIKNRNSLGFYSRIIKMIKKIKCNRIPIIFLLLLISLEPASGTTFLEESKIAIPIILFLIINIPTQFITISLLLEVANTSKSNVWNDLLLGLFFNILQTIAVANLINFRYPTSNIYILVTILMLYSIGVFSVIIPVYLLAIPIIKKLNFLRIRYILLYVLSLLTLYFGINYVSHTHYTPFGDGKIIYGFLFLYLIIIVYFPGIMFHISDKYTHTGFVRTPFLVAGVGLVAILMFFILILVTLRPIQEYYYVLILFITSIFTLVYYLRYCVNYPSIINRKWKILMPFDFPKVTIAFTLSFLTLSFYLTARGHPNFIMYQNISYIFIIAFLLPILITITFIFLYMNKLFEMTKLRYWKYLEYGQYIHLAVTFYVFNLIILAWKDMGGSTKLLCAVFGLVAFAFYLSFALDLRTILKDQDIKPIFGSLDLFRYIISFYSCFFLLFFGFVFVYGKEPYLIEFDLMSYPVLPFFIAFFLIAFGTYLIITHKGFEEILGKNIWNEVSYIFAFFAFILIYLIYHSLNTFIQQFPYHNLVFIGYFIVLIIEIISSRTLAEKFKYTKARKEDIVSLLNFHSHNFLRTDYLEDLWNKALDKYVAGDEVKKIVFDPSKRRFDLAKIDEKTQTNIAIEILLGMHKVPNPEKVTIQIRAIEELKEDIVAILGERILMLPEDLRSEFDERMYYPILLEKAMSDLFTHLKTFIPFAEHKALFDQLKRREQLFECVRFEAGELRVKEGTRFTRQDFLKLFRLYIEAIGEEFPFKRCLLHGLVKEEVKTGLQTITVGEVLDIVPTGLRELDRVMEGGLVRGSSTLLIAEETKAKHRILISFINQALKAGTFTIYATSQRPFQQILGELRMKTERLENFEILDLYETIHTEERVTEVAEVENRIIVPFSKLLFQRSLVKAIKSKPRDAPKIVIMDVYDEFSRYFNPKEILALLQQQVEGFKRWNCTSLITLNPYSYLTKKEGVEEVKKNFDNIIILSGGDKDTSVFIEKLYHGTPFGHISHLPW